MLMAQTPGRVMPIVTCPKCGRNLKAPDEAIEKKVKCRCGQIFSLDTPPTLPRRKSPVPLVLTGCVVSAIIASAVTALVVRAMPPEESTKPLLPSTTAVVDGTAQLKSQIAEQESRPQPRTPDALRDLSAKGAFVRIEWPASHERES
jgi:hypothetical protein